MKNARIILVLAGLAAYLLLFFSADLPTLRDKTGEDWQRGQFVFALCIDLPDLVIAPWFGNPPEFSVLDRLPVILTAGAILGWAACLGWLLMAAVRADRGLSRLEVFVFAMAVGLGAIGTFVLAAGLIGWLGCKRVFITPALLTFAGAAWLYLGRGGSVARLFRSANSPKDKQSKKHRDKRSSKHPSRHKTKQPGLMDFLTAPVGELSPHWLWLALPFVLIIILGGMLPPVDFDVREYHLQAPKEFFQQGQITFLRHNVYANMPLGAEMFALLGMVVTGDWWLGALVGKTVIAAMAPLTALALLAAGRRFFSTSAGVVAALVYISIPWTVQVSMLGLVEGLLAYYLFLAVYALMLFGRKDDGQADRPPDSTMLLLAGYLAGSAAAIKYPAMLFVVVPLAAWVVVRELRTAGEDVPTGISRSVSAARSCGVFLLAAAIGCGLWYGKNWFLTGNPTYPLLYGVFGGESWTPEKDRTWNYVHLPHDFSSGGLATDLKKVGWRSEWLSPLVVPLAVLAFLSWKRQRRLMLLLLAYFAFVIAAWWLLTHRIDRFWVPITAVPALLAGAGACWCRERWWRVALTAFLVTGLGTNFLLAGWGWGNNGYFVGLNRLRHDARRVDPWHEYLNTHAGDGRVLLVGDAQVFDIEVPLLYNTCFDTCLFEELARDRTPEQVRAALAEQGITHVYVHWGEIARYRRTGYGFTNFVQPDVFEEMVAAGVLEPLPGIGDHPARAYRVRD